MLLFGHIPTPIQTALAGLQNNGFDSYLVGGCVRDCLLNKTPNDWDITTNAYPESIQKIFCGYPVIETGIQHGTVTVIMEHFPIEITTYRVDGTYTDHRHPDQVQFTSSLKDDLSRRDFTINALAWSASDGVIDFFNGQKDLKNGVLRCVGDPIHRFQEDALRILRALRFASTLDFTIEKETAHAIHLQKDLLRHVASERIQKELVKLLCGDAVETIILEYYDVLSVFIPPLKQMKGFQQYNPHHIYDVLEHTAKAVSVSSRIKTVRLALLFHDIGKPSCLLFDEKGVGHFYGHAQKSVHITNDILEKLKFDRHTLETVIDLVRYHDAVLRADKKIIKRWLQRLGADKLRLLIQVRIADTLALAEPYHDRVKEIQKINDIITQIQEDEECFSLKHLAINGNDLISAGIPQSKQIGDILTQLLKDVIDEICENKKEILLKRAYQMIKEQEKIN